MTRLEHAALEYLKAIESNEEDVERVNKAEDELKSCAILWAQGYALKLPGFCNSEEKK